MKSIKIMSCILAAGMLFTSCNMTNTGKGALIGGGSGAAVGAGLGAIFGKGKGRWRMDQCRIHGAGAGSL